MSALLAASELAAGPCGVWDRHAYERGRPRLRPSIIALKSRRRVRLGDLGCLSFENRITVAYQICEVLRAEGWTDARLLRELATYRGLLPGRRQLCATLMIDGSDSDRCLELGRLAAAPRGLTLAFGRSLHVKSEPIDTQTDPFEPVHYLRFHLPAFPTSTERWAVWVGRQRFDLTADTQAELCRDLDVDGDQWATSGHA